MRLRFRSIRHAADFPPDGEAALRPIPGLGGVDLLALVWAAQGLAALDWAMFRRGPEGQTRPQADPPNGVAGDAVPAPKIKREIAHTAQPSGADGVPEDMATLVLDNSALGAGACCAAGRRARARECRSDCGT